MRRFVTAMALSAALALGGALAHSPSAECSGYCGGACETRYDCGSGCSCSSSGRCFNAF